MSLIQLNSVWSDMPSERAAAASVRPVSTRRTVQLELNSVFHAVSVGLSHVLSLRLLRHLARETFFRARPIVTREPIPDFLSVEPESLSNLSWTPAEFGLQDSAWWPEENTEGELGVNKR